MAAGIVYLSEDRKGKGLLLQQNLRTNLTLAALERFTRGLSSMSRAENAALDTAIRDFDIRTRRRDLLAGQLSGGNQQKLLLAKMMLAEPRIVIIDEPTRGVDIGNKEQIYRFIAGLGRAGPRRHRHLVRDAGTDRPLPPGHRHAQRPHRRRGCAEPN